MTREADEVRDVRRDGETAEATSATQAGAAERAGRPRITYRDVIMGRAVVPSDRIGFFVFQALMVIGMVSIMATFNGVRADGIDFVIHNHWVYPIVFVFAFVWRRTVANAISGFLIPRLVAGRLSGPAACLAKSAINVTSMNPFVCLFVGLLTRGPAGAVSFLVASQPLSLVAAIGVNFLVVGPVIKMLVINHVDATDNVRLLLRSHRALRPVMVLFGMS